MTKSSAAIASDVNQLLDDSLEDFGQVKISSLPKDKSHVTPTTTTSPIKQNVFNNDEDTEITKGIESFLQNMTATTSATMPESSTSNNISFTDTIEATLRSLEEKPMDHLKESEMMGVFQNLWQSYGRNDMGSGEDGGNANDMFNDSIIDSLVDKILSKDLLFDPLKELDDKYPSWLESNHPSKNGSISPKQYDIYTAQSQYLHELIVLWQQNEAGDNTHGPTHPTKNHAWDLLQKVQDCGHPPKDLLPKDSGSQSSGDPMSDCSMM